MKINECITPLLELAESDIISYELYVDEKPNYEKETLRAATKIFVSVLMDKMYDLQEKENISFEDRCKMAEHCGRDIRNLIKIYTDIDTFDFYK